MAFATTTSAGKIRFYTANNTTALTIDSSQNIDAVGSVKAYSFIKDGGANSEFLKADGSTDSNTYLTTSSASSTYLPLAGGTITGNVKFNDNAELRLGSGADLKLYHNGTTNNSNIENNVGGLYITNYADDSDIVFRSDDGSGEIGRAHV